MQTSVFENGIIMLDTGPYGYHCSTEVSQS
jgi:hypothetical protein